MYLSNATGFPKQDACFSKVKKIYIPDLLSDDREGKIIENIDFEYLSNRASFMVHMYHTQI